MLAKRRDQWTEADLLSVARLIVDPATNGGTHADGVTPYYVARELPVTPCLAVFDEEGRAAFVVGLWPYNPSIPRGVLHVAGDGRVPEAWRIVRDFLAALPDVEVFTLTANPALARLARRAGLSVLGEKDGTLILGR